MRLALILLACLLVAGCVISGEGGQASQQGASGGASRTGGVLAQRSPWTTPGSIISRAPRLTTPSGIDLREAKYILHEVDPTQVGGGEPKVILRLRDYTARTDRAADRQYLARLDTATGGVARIELASGVVPVSITVSATDEDWVLNGLAVPKSGDVISASTVIQLHPKVGEPVDLVLDAPLQALGFRADGAILGRAVKRITLDGGIPSTVLDWSSSARVYNLLGQEWQDTSVKSFTVSPGGVSSAGYHISHEASLPGSSIVSYHLVRTRTARGAEELVHASPYHVTYSANPWEPSLCWVNDSCLAMVDFLPNATGSTDRANYQGLFRLISVSTTGGGTQLIEDHLDAGLPITAGGGVVFYTRRIEDGNGGTWELWAASANGLAKRRLMEADSDTILMSVLDEFNGRRLLVHRQYLVIENNEPLLLSELLEFGLDELSESKAAGLDLEPIKPFEQAGSTGDLSRFAFEESDGLRPPPISIPK